DRDSRNAAAMDAEERSTSTSLDPAIERYKIEPMLEGWQQARSNSNEMKMKEAAEKIGEVLTAEAEHRWRLTVRALEHLRADPRRMNSGIKVLVTEGLKEQWYQHTRIELNVADAADGPAFVASPETDRYPAAAGSRYQVHLASAELRDSVLLHDDREMQAEAIAQGDAFRGKIVKVEDRGEGRKSSPYWTIEDSIGGQLRLREGSWVCVAGMPKRTGIIEYIEDHPGGG